jgi:hypothetical protein
VCGVGSMGVRFLLLYFWSGLLVDVGSCVFRMSLIALLRAGIRFSIVVMCDCKSFAS